MKKQSILLLTAGYWQKPIINCAKRLGLTVIVTDINPNAPSAHLADEFVCMDSVDVDGLTQLVRDRGISGILAEQTDVAVATAA